MRSQSTEYLPIPGAARPLPAWRTFGELDEADLPTPETIVNDLLRRGELSVLGGASKSFKSWAAIDLGIAVACGRPWMGRATRAGRVLIVNLELPEWCIRSRIRSIARERGDEINPDNLLVWTLRGHSPEPHDIREEIIESELNISLIIIDPIYRLLGSKDENSARDINALLSEIARMAEEMSAHVLLPAHFAKGNAAAKESMDRISGSGVYARFPDTLMILTRHEQDGAFTLDFTLRTFPPQAPVVARWQHPAFVLDGTLDPARLKQPSRGAKPKYDQEAIAALLADGPLSGADWLAKASLEFGIPRKTFADYKARLIDQKLVIKSATGDMFYIPKESEKK